MFATINDEQIESIELAIISSDSMPLDKINLIAKYQIDSNQSCFLEYAKLTSKLSQIIVLPVHVARHRQDLVYDNLFGPTLEALSKLNKQRLREFQITVLDELLIVHYGEHESVD